MTSIQNWLGFRATLAATLISAVTFLGAAGDADAHAFSIGYANAGPGSVTVWLGTYQHSGHHLEGSLNLLGVNGNSFASTTVPFTQLTADGVSNKPVGLIDGTTNFFVSTALNVPGPLVGSDALWLSTLSGAVSFPGPANHWEGATFSGLTAGDYQFMYVADPNPSVEWQPWNESLNGVFNISGAVINTPVPEPSTYGLLMAGLFALGFIARRRMT